MNICVVGGAGYVGLITGIGLSEVGHKVVNFDIDNQKIKKLQDGCLPIYESGLGKILRNNIDVGRLRFTTDMEDAVSSGTIIFVAVGTPIDADGWADLSDLTRVSEDLGCHMDGYKVLAIRSTVPPGSIEEIRSILSTKRSEGKDFDIVVNPEFLREGYGLFDFLSPDRIVIGSDSEKATMLMRQVYEPILERRIGRSVAGDNNYEDGLVPFIDTDVKSAQMIKYCSNAFLAARVSFVNEIAGLCEMVEADIKEVAKGIGYDPRIGHKYLDPGLGFGGPCIEKDLRALIQSAEHHQYDPLMLKAILMRNDQQIEDIISKLRSLLGGSLKGTIVAAFGLAFKAGTNDVRNSLAVKVVRILMEEGVTVKVTDPNVASDDVSLGNDVIWCEDPYEASHQANAVVILTEWDSFLELDYHIIKSNMVCANIVDGRNLLDPEYLKAIGFKYSGVGRS